MHNLKLFDLAGVIDFSKEKADENAGRMLRVAERLEEESKRAFLLAEQFACVNAPLRKLKALEAAQNEGRGVSCVRTLIMYLERGQYNAARACFNNENDKIRCYPEIYKLLIELLP